MEALAFSRRRVTFTVPGIPQPKGSTRMVRTKGQRSRIIADNPKVAGWEKDVAIVARFAARGRMFVGPVALQVTFYLPRPERLPKGQVTPMTRPDLDKLVRAIGDALSGVMYGDDGQVVALHAAKLYASGIVPVSVQITVTEADTADLVLAHGAILPLQRDGYDDEELGS